MAQQDTPPSLDDEAFTLLQFNIIPHPSITPSAPASVWLYFHNSYWRDASAERFTAIHLRGPHQVYVETRRREAMPPPLPPNYAIAYDDVRLQPFGEEDVDVGEMEGALRRGLVVDDEDVSEEGEEEQISRGCGRFMVVDESEDEDEAGFDDFELELELEHQYPPSKLKRRTIGLLLILFLLYALFSLLTCLTKNLIHRPPSSLPNSTTITPPTIHVNTSVFTDFATLKLSLGSLSYFWLKSLSSPQTQDSFPTFTALNSSLSLCDRLCHTLVTFGTVWDGVEISEPSDENRWWAPAEGYRDMSEDGDVDVYSYCAATIRTLEELRTQLDLTIQSLPTAWIDAAHIHLGVLSYRLFLLQDYHKWQAQEGVDDDEPFQLAPLAYLLDSLAPDSLSRLRKRREATGILTGRLESLEEAMEVMEQFRKLFTTAVETLGEVEAHVDVIFEVASGVVAGFGGFNPLQLWRARQLGKLLSEVEEPLRHGIRDTAETLRGWMDEEDALLAQEARLFEYVSALLNATTLFKPDELGAMIGGTWIRNPWVRPWEDERPVYRDARGRLAEEQGVMVMVVPPVEKILEGVERAVQEMALIERVWGREGRAWFERAYPRKVKKEKEKQEEQKEEGQEK